MQKFICCDNQEVFENKVKEYLINNSWKVVPGTNVAVYAPSERWKNDVPFGYFAVVLESIEKY